jgi:hypothetical protein
MSICTHTMAYVDDNLVEVETDTRKRRTSLSWEEPWTANSGDRLKGKNVIAQQVDLKMFPYLSVSSHRPLLKERLSNTNKYDSNLHLLFALRTSAVQMDDVRIKCISSSSYHLNFLFVSGTRWLRKCWTVCRRVHFSFREMGLKCSPNYSIQESHAAARLIMVLLTNSVAQESESSSPHSQQPATGPYPEPVESNPPPTPKPVFLRSILIPSSHLRLCLPSGIFPSGFPTKALHNFLSSPMRATCPAHLIRLDWYCS